jgi:hypothetical protein
VEELLIKAADLTGRAMLIRTGRLLRGLERQAKAMDAERKKASIVPIDRLSRGVLSSIALLHALVNLAEHR